MSETAVLGITGIVASAGVGILALLVQLLVAFHSASEARRRLRYEESRDAYLETGRSLSRAVAASGRLLDAQVNASSSSEGAAAETLLDKTQNDFYEKDVENSLRRSHFFDRPRHVSFFVLAIVDLIGKTDGLEKALVDGTTREWLTTRDRGLHALLDGYFSLTGAAARSELRSRPGRWYARRRLSNQLLKWAKAEGYIPKDEAATSEAVSSPKAAA